MIRHLILVLASFTTVGAQRISSKPDGELTATNIAQRRHISEYIDAGNVDCSRLETDYPSHPPGKGKCDERVIGDFVWKIWQARSKDTSARPTRALTLGQPRISSSRPPKKAHPRSH